tara:strand:+ start:123 stop:425 length:303 start_codon:yes stop_codon:yes gene_type:complete
MNVVTNLISRIEEYRASNKTPCKSYANEAKATAVAETFAKKYADYFTAENSASRPCRYVVAFNAAWGRWVIGFDFSELIQRSTSTGGYLGVASNDGFYTY